MVYTGGRATGQIFKFAASCEELTQEIKKSRHIFCQPSTVKYMFIKDNSAWINIDIACEILELSRSSYYEWNANYDNPFIA